MARLKKGDTIIVLSGRDRGKRGKILRLLPVRDAALVERINLLKHFERRGRADQPGGIIEREAPIALAKLALVCPRCQKATRIKMRVTNGTKQRVCHRCQETLA